MKCLKDGSFVWSILGISLMLVIYLGGTSSFAEESNYQYDSQVVFYQVQPNQSEQYDADLKFDIRSREREQDFLLTPMMNFFLPCGQTTSHILENQKIWTGKFQAKCNNQGGIQLNQIIKENYTSWRLEFITQDNVLVFPSEVAVLFDNERESRQQEMTSTVLRKGTFVATQFKITTKEYDVVEVRWEKDDKKIASHKLVCIVARKKRESDIKPEDFGERQITPTPPNKVLSQGKLSIFLDLADRKQEALYWDEYTTSLIVLFKEGRNEWQYVSMKMTDASVQDCQIDQPITINLPVEDGKQITDLMVFGEKDSKLVSLMVRQNVRDEYRYTIDVIKKPQDIWVKIPESTRTSPLSTSIQVKVKSANGTVIEGAKVSVLIFRKPWYSDIVVVDVAYGETDNMGNADISVFSKVFTNDHVMLTCYHPEYIGSALMEGELGDILDRSISFILQKSPYIKQHPSLHSKPYLFWLRIKDSSGQSLAGARVSVEKNQIMTTSITQANGIVYLPLKNTKNEQTSVRIEATGYELYIKQGLWNDLLEQFANNNRTILLRRLFKPIVLSLKLLDAKKGTVLTNLRNASASISQNKTSLTQVQFQPEGYATAELQIDPQQGGVEISVNAPGYEPITQSLTTLPDSYQELPFLLKASGQGLLVLINAAETWQEYVQTKSTIISTMNELFQNPEQWKYSFVGVGATSGNASLARQAESVKDKKIMSQMLQEFNGITAMSGLIQPQEVFNIIEYHKNVLSESGKWRIILVIPHNQWIQWDTTERTVIDQFITTLQREGGELSIIEDLSMTGEDVSNRVLQEICQATGGQYIPLHDMNDLKKQLNHIINKED